MLFDYHIGINAITYISYYQAYLLSLFNFTYQILIP
jgi:hypothetical protein